MDQKEVIITYETLYELFRREKSREELGKLDENFFTDLLDYLREKQQLYDGMLNKTDIFSLTERDKLHNQLYNIRRLIKDLYERREQKIIDMALNKSRANCEIFDTNNLLDVEKKLYGDMISLLGNFRDNILTNILELKQPYAESLISQRVDPIPSPKPIPSPDPMPSPEPDSPPEPEPTPEPDRPQEEKIKVKFLKEVYPFVGRELESYGPYNTGDSADLPPEVAEVLIKSGKAEQA